jgi:hypothetical protein
MRLGIEFLLKTSTSENEIRENRLSESNSLPVGANELLGALFQFVDRSE